MANNAENVKSRFVNNDADDVDTFFSVRCCQPAFGLGCYIEVCGRR